LSLFIYGRWAMTVHELNAPADVVEATVMALVKTHNNKAQQAKERSALRGWFVGQTMKKLNGAVSRHVVQEAVFKALQ
jgi:Asp-tRNA(Asn)/Glu-tRNA(Gln) amidotransferase B subunit